MAIVVSAAVIVIAGSFIYSSLGHSGTPSNFTTTETTNNSLGIELTLLLSSSTIQTNQTITATSSVVNVLSSVNNVSAASSWALPIYQGGCQPAWSIQFFQGYYVSSNITTASTPLQMYPNVSPPPECPVMRFAYYVFQPSSSLAYIPQVPKGYNVSMTTQIYAMGYYNPGVQYPTGQTTPGLVPAPAPFPVGHYTVVAYDEWGQILIEHFTVVSTAT